MKIASKILLLSIALNLNGSLIFSEENHEKHHPATEKKIAPVKKAQPKKSAHGDHSPKHGGQFFMAPNKFHHLEGVLASASEFRVYFYDDHTKPVPAGTFRDKSKVEVQRIGADGRETGTPLQLPLTVDPAGDFLSAAVPGEMKLPLYFSAWLMFPNQKEPDLFNFSFDKVAETGRMTPSAPSPKMTMYQCPMKDSDPQGKPGKCPKCGMNMEPIKS